jgi:hypothetical protein
MLAEDPEHRPAPLLLADTEVARSRRVAARPPQRAQRPIEVGYQSAWTARTLAYAIAVEPDAGLAALRSGEIDRWIRRSLGDSALAGRLDEAARLRSGPGDAASVRENAAVAIDDDAQKRRALFFANARDIGVNLVTLQLLKQQ